MRRFEVWLDVGYAGVEPRIEIVEMPDDATDDECDADCQDCCDTMISNYVDTGWREL